MNSLYDIRHRSVIPVFNLVQIVKATENSKRNCNDKSSEALRVWKASLIDYSQLAFNYKLIYLRSFCSDLQMLLSLMHDAPWELDRGMLDQLAARFLVMDKVSEMRPIL